ncbi:MAG: hypothetical protein D6732_23640 [Methanobacteriota archaeon]|nr:MAG: hypothetical protein D6732_23640 [Euryarchaeota archaeon]
MPRDSFLSLLNFWLGVILSLVGISKVITIFFFKTYLGMWDPVDELLLKTAIPLYVLQISMQLILLYWLFEGWKKDMIRKELSDEHLVNAILFFLGLYFEEKGSLLVLFALSFAMYVILLILVSLSRQKIEQKSTDLVSHFVQLLLTIILVNFCLVCY